MKYNLIYLPIYLSTYLFICLSVYLSICLMRKTTQRETGKENKREQQWTMIQHKDTQQFLNLFTWVFQTALLQLSGWRLHFETFCFGVRCLLGFQLIEERTKIRQGRGKPASVLLMLVNPNMILQNVYEKYCLGAGRSQHQTTRYDWRNRFGVDLSQASYYKCPLAKTNPQIFISNVHFAVRFHCSNLDMSLCRSWF